jgi:hypothetical protein
MAEAVCGFQQVSEKPAAKPGAENCSLPTIQSDFAHFILRSRALVSAEFKADLVNNRLLTFLFKNA